MAIFTAIGTAVATVLFGSAAVAAGTLAATLTAALVSGGLALGASLALSYIMRPKARTYSAIQGQKEYGARVPAWAAYGEVKVKGHDIFYAKWGEGDKYNASVLVLSNGWCDGLQPEVYFYGKKHTLIPRATVSNEVAHYGVEGFGNHISIRFYDGRPGQLADMKLVGDTSSLGMRWRSSSVVAGHTYVVWEMEYDSDLFSDGYPEPEFILRGLRLYNPTKDSTVAGGSGSHRLDDPSTYEWSKNPALQRLNYQLGLRGLISGRPIIGEGKTLGELDLGSYFTAINYCESRPYECNLIVTAEDDHTEILKEFDDAMAGYGMNRNGLSGVIVGAPQIPVLTLTDDDIDAGRSKQVRYRKSAYDLFNHLSGQFISKANQWNPESLTPIRVNTDVAADGKIRPASNDFLQVTDPDIAQYLLQIRYRQNRKGGQANLPVSRRVGFKVTEGQWIEWEGREWLITRRAFNENMEFTLVLSETSADVYSSAGIEPGPIVVPPDEPVNPSRLQTVQNFGVEAGLLTNDAGEEYPVLKFTWDPPADPTITQVRFEYKVDDGNGPFSTADLIRDETADPESGEYITTKGVVGTKIYVARATITTVPDRLKSWTEWKTTTVLTNRFRIRQQLADMGSDIYGYLDDLHTEMDRMKLQMQIMAAAGSTLGGQQMIQNGVSVRFGDALAGAIQKFTAEITDLGNAQAALQNAVYAVVGNLESGSLWRMTAEAGSGDVVARVMLQVRATVGDDWMVAATLWEAGFVGGDPMQPFSRFVVDAATVVFRDPTTDFPLFVIEGGVAWLDEVRIRNLTAVNIAVAGVETESIALNAVTYPYYDTFGAVPTMTGIGVTYLNTGPVVDIDSGFITGAAELDFSCHFSSNGGILYLYVAIWDVAEEEYLETEFAGLYYILEGPNVNYGQRRFSLPLLWKPDTPGAYRFDPAYQLIPNASVNVSLTQYAAKIGILHAMR